VLDCRGFYFEPNTSAWRKRFISNSSHRLTWVLVASSLHLISTGSRLGTCLCRTISPA